jgi:hypothetical protein
MYYVNQFIATWWQGMNGPKVYDRGIHNPRSLFNHTEQPILKK